MDAPEPEEVAAGAVELLGRCGAACEQLGLSHRAAIWAFLADLFRPDPDLLSVGGNGEGGGGGGDAASRILWAAPALWVTTPG